LVHGGAGLEPHWTPPLQAQQQQQQQQPQNMLGDEKRDTVQDLGSSYVMVCDVEGLSKKTTNNLRRAENAPFCDRLKRGEMWLQFSQKQVVFQTFLANRPDFHIFLPALERPTENRGAFNLQRAWYE
jgi:hypothetical protein